MSSSTVSTESAFDRVYDLIKKNTKKDNLEECSDFKKLKRVLTEIIDIDYIQNYIKSIKTYKDESNNYYYVDIEFCLNKRDTSGFGSITIVDIGNGFTMSTTRNIIGDQLYTMDSYLYNKDYVIGCFELFYTLVNKDLEYTRLKEEYDSFVKNIRDAVPQFLAEKYHPNN